MPFRHQIRNKTETAQTISDRTGISQSHFLKMCVPVFVKSFLVGNLFILATFEIQD